RTPERLARYHENRRCAPAPVKDLSVVVVVAVVAAGCFVVTGFLVVTGTFPGFLLLLCDAFGYVRLACWSRVKGECVQRKRKCESKKFAMWIEYRRGPPCQRVADLTQTSISLDRPCRTLAKDLITPGVIHYCIITRPDSFCRTGPECIGLAVIVAGAVGVVIAAAGEAMGRETGPVRALLHVQERTPERLADTVNTAVALHPSKTCASVLAVAFIERCLAGDTDTGSLLSILLAGVGAARWEPPWRAIQLRHPPSRSGAGTYASLHFCGQLE
ncbi:hypothetical protein EDB87DRAFT_1638925, partial [Lactarius vividus]